MPLTVSVVNCLKTSGKTYTTLQLAYVLASYQQRVLLIDADPLAGLTVRLAPSRPILEWYPAITRKGPLQIRSITDYIALLPAGSSMALGDFECSLDRDRARFQAFFQEVGADFDFVLIDTPATNGFFTKVAVSASQAVIVPMLAAGLHLQGLSRISEVLAGSAVERVLSFFPRPIQAAGWVGESRATEITAYLGSIVAKAPVAGLLTHSPLGLADVHDLFMELYAPA